MGELDPSKLLKSLPRAIAEAQRTARALRAGNLAETDFPSASQRWLTSRETIEAVRDRKGDPAAPALVDWLFVLTLLRVNLDAARSIAHAFRAPKLVRVRKPEAAELSLHVALGRLVTEGRDVREDTLVGVTHAGPALGDPIVEAAARAQEIARRAGFSHVDEVFSPFADPAGHTLAAELTADTNDLARDLLAAGESLGGVLARVTACDLAVPFPRAVSPAWLASLFGKETGVFEVPGLSPGPLPNAIGPSSYARIFARLGAGYADAATACEVLPPFGATPTELRRRTYGALFASLLCSMPFLRRVLGFSAREAAAARRAYALVFLAHARLAAAKLLARDALLSGNGERARREAADHTAQALYTEIPRGLALVLPQPRLADPGSFAALCQGATLARTLHERFDEDWFRNPRAFAALRDDLARQEPRRLELASAREGKVALVATLLEHVS